MRPFDENDLIAFHLQELAPRRRRALERALRTDASLAQESAAVAATLQAFQGHTAFDLDRNLVERNWLTLEPLVMKAPPTPAPRFRWNNPFVFAGGVALGAFMVAAYHHSADTVPLQIQPNHATGAAMPTFPRGLQPNTSFATPATGRPVERGEKGLIRRSIHPSRQLLFASAQSAQDAPTHAVAHTGMEAGPVPSGPVDSPASAPAIAQAAPVATPSSGETTLASNQSATGSTKRYGASAHRYRISDVTLAMGGTFIPTRDGAKVNNTQLAQGATHAVSALASFHQQFRPRIGYRVTASYTRPDFHYLDSTSGQQEINGRIFELAGTYVVEGPHRGRLSTQAEAGVGVMAILATVDSPATSSNTRAAGIVGFSTEMTLTNRLALRAGYRGQVFEGPDFRAVKTVYPLAVSNILISHEPYVGITYRFQRKQ